MAAPSLPELRARRAFECRLDPVRALGSPDDAAAFLDDRGILTRTADCALPSLFEACHQPAFRPGKGGFAEWPETAYPWFAELAARDGVVQLAVHRGKRVLMTRAVAGLADPLCRAGLRAAETGGGDSAVLLAHYPPLDRRTWTTSRSSWSGMPPACGGRGRRWSGPAPWSAAASPSRRLTAVTRTRACSRAGTRPLQRRPARDPWTS